MLEVTVALLKKVKSNSSVHAIFKKSVATNYRAYRSGDMDRGEWTREYDKLLYRCSLMVD